MLETKTARISIVLRSAKEYKERPMGEAEVAAVQSWVDSKALEHQQLSPERAELQAVESSLAAQASHYHEETAERIDDVTERIKLALQPDFPAGASPAEQLAFLQDQVEAANKTKRQIRVEQNLAKCGKAALATSFGDQPVLEEKKAALRDALEAHDLEIQNIKRKRELEKSEARAGKREKASSSTAPAADAAPAAAAPPAAVAPVVAKSKAKATRVKLTDKEKLARRADARRAKRQGKAPGDAGVEGDDEAEKNIAAAGGEDKEIIAAAVPPPLASQPGSEVELVAEPAVPGDASEQPEVELEQMLEELLADDDASANVGVDAPDEQRTAAPVVPGETADKYADHDWSDPENDIPGTSSSECSDEAFTCDAHHRHARERRERAEDDDDKVLKERGGHPPDRHRRVHALLTTRNERYRLHMRQQLDMSSTGQSSGSE
jgi:hypothetical protein